MSKPLPEIHKCACGADTEVLGCRFSFVACRRDPDGCWTGPIRKTERAAIEAWNRVMGAKEGK